MNPEREHLVGVGPFNIEKYRRKIGDAFINYSINKKTKLRALTILVQIKDSRNRYVVRDSYLIKLSIEAIYRLMNRIKQDGRISYCAIKKKRWEFVDFSKGESFSKEKSRSRMLKVLRKKKKNVMKNG